MKGNVKLASKKNKCFAVVFILLFLGYYQRWLYAVIYESMSGSVNLDPALPMMLNDLGKLQGGGGGGGDDAGGGDEITALQMERQGASSPISAQAYLKTDPKVQAIADALSQRIQKDIDDTQKGLGRDCRGQKIICGPEVDCGLGCQIHGMMSCLMVAYSTNRTLIPDFRNWPYSVPWSDVLQPIGAFDCSTDNDTAVVRWNKPGFSLIHSDHKISSFKSGLPVPFNIGPDLRRLPTDHFIWWIGQFAKYTLRLQSFEEELMKKFEDVLKLKLPTVGIIVRKRDKRGEKKKLEAHSIDKYMGVAKKYFSKLEETQDNVTRRIFLSTDDRNVFKLIRKRYPPPRYEILGFQRKTQFEDIIKDIYILSECDFVVCSYSSDICRLVLELKESRELNSSFRVKSIGYKHFYSTQGFNRLRFLLRYA